jgi:hypothetical protein
MSNYLNLDAESTDSRPEVASNKDLGASAALKAAYNDVMSLHDYINELEDRLAPILVEAKESWNGPDQDSGSQSPITEEVRTLSVRINAARNHVSNILTRINL